MFQIGSWKANTNDQNRSAEFRRRVLSPLTRQPQLSEGRPKAEAARDAWFAARREELASLRPSPSASIDEEVAPD